MHYGNTKVLAFYSTWNISLLLIKIEVFISLLFNHQNYKLQRDPKTGLDRAESASAWFKVTNTHFCSRCQWQAANKTRIGGRWKTNLVFRWFLVERIHWDFIKRKPTLKHGHFVKVIKDLLCHFLPSIAQPILAHTYVGVNRWAWARILLSYSMLFSLQKEHTVTHRGFAQIKPWFIHSHLNISIGVQVLATFAPLTEHRLVLCNR